MNREIDLWAWSVGRDLKLKPALRITLLALAVESWRSTWCAIVNIEALMEETGIPYGTLRRHLNDLCEQGLIRRARLRKPNGKLAGYAFWLKPTGGDWPILHLKDGFTIIEESADGAVSTIAARPALKLSAGVYQRSNRNQNERANKDSQPESSFSQTTSSRKRATKSKKAALPADFETFWKTATDKMRQRSDAKAKVERVFRPLAGEHGADALTAALRGYVRSEDVQAGLGQPGLHRWLANGKFEAFLPAEIGHGEWRKALELNRKTGWWSEKFGPRPGEVGCRAPPALLGEHAQLAVGGAA